MTVNNLRIQNINILNPGLKYWQENEIHAATTGTTTPEA